MAATSNQGLSIQQPSIPIFNGENYDYCSLKMKTLFQSQDLWDLVENGYEEPESVATLSSTQREALRENKKKDAKALFFIQQAITESLFPRIMRVSKSKEAWSVLQEEFQGSAKVRAIKLQNLRRELENMKMLESESLKEYFSRVTEIVNQMGLYGEVVTDKKIVEKILISLPEKYDAMVSIIEETKDIATLSVRELMASLQTHEQRLLRHSEKSIESALQSKLNLAIKPRESSSQEHQRGESFRGGRFGRGRSQGGRGRGNFDRSSSVEGSWKKCSICKRSSHVDKDCWFKGKSQCYNCKKFGHLQKDCRLKNEQANVSEEKEDEHGVFYANCQVASEKNDGVWLLDSGCSNHILGTKVFSQKWMKE